MSGIEVIGGVSMPSQAVFLDRDNTLIHDPGYLSNPADVHLIDGVSDGLKSLTGAGFKLVIVTNQAGVARGYFGENDTRAVNAEVIRQLSEAGVSIDAVYYCPYHPDGIVEPFNQEHPDRKPNPGMLLRAAKDMDIELARSWMIGDTARDAEAGKRAGCRTICVISEEMSSESPPPDADYRCRNISEAASIILGRLKAKTS